MVGDPIGEGAARQEAVVGETSNLATRLQALAEPNGVMIAPRTRRLLGDLFDLADLGAHDPKCFANSPLTKSLFDEQHTTFCMYRWA